MFGRDRIAKAASELADHLQVIENVRALQTGQKELANAIKSLADQVQELRVEVHVMRADVRLDTLRETQNIVNAVQGGLNQRIEALAVKVAVVENSYPDRPSGTIHRLISGGEGSD